MGQKKQGIKIQLVMLLPSDVCTHAKHSLLSLMCVSYAYNVTMCTDDQVGREREE